MINARKGHVVKDKAGASYLVLERHRGKFLVVPWEGKFGGDGKPWVSPLSNRMVIPGEAVQWARPHPEEVARRMAIDWITSMSGEKLSRAFDFLDRLRRERRSGPKRHEITHGGETQP